MGPKIVEKDKITLVGMVSYGGDIGALWEAFLANDHLIKHNVENWESEQLFFNEPLIILDDPQHSTSEQRWAAFGKTDTNRYLVVVFTRRSSLLRIISARRMNKKERMFYDENG